LQRFSNPLSLHDYSFSPFKGRTVLFGPFSRAGGAAAFPALFPSCVMFFPSTTPLAQRSFLFSFSPFHSRRRSRCTIFLFCAVGVWVELLLSLLARRSLLILSFFSVGRGRFFFFLLFLLMAALPFPPPCSACRGFHFCAAT